MALLDPTPDARETLFVSVGSEGSNRHLLGGLPVTSFWVFLSGKEIIGRKRAWKPCNWHYLATPIIWLLIGVAGVQWTWHQTSLASALVYVVSMILIVGGARYFVATTIHMMAHHLMFARAATNHWWGEIFSTIFLIQGIDRYRSDHLAHHGKSFATLQDGDAMMVLKLGFVAGKSRRDLWINLIRLCFSPGFHFQFFVGRLNENLLRCGRVRAAMTLAWFVILIAAGYAFGFWTIWNVYIVPICILIQVPALIQLLCEHVYISADLSARERHKLLSNGRYCGVALPQPKPNKVRYAADVIVWVLRIVFVELPARIIIFQGSLPEHDWHHRHPGSRRWADGRMLREMELRDLAATSGETGFLEAWGSVEIVDRVFRSISRARPYPEQDELIASGTLDHGDIK